MRAGAGQGLPVLPLPHTELPPPASLLQDRRELLLAAISRWRLWEPRCCSPPETPSPLLRGSTPHKTCHQRSWGVLCKPSPSWLRLRTGCLIGGERPSSRLSSTVPAPGTVSRLQISAGDPHPQPNPLTGRQEEERRDPPLPKCPTLTSASPALPPAQCPIFQASLPATTLPPPGVPALG